MNVTVTTNQSWFSRIGGAFAGVIIGLILIPLCIWALSWNEGRAVQTERSLKEGAGAVVSVPSTAVSPANEGKLIHTTGTVVIADPLVDPEFGVTAAGVRLNRNAEMYQWVESSKSETRTKLGGGQETVTTYSYAKEWKSEAVDSSQFQQQALLQDAGGHVRMSHGAQVHGVELPQFVDRARIAELLTGCIRQLRETVGHEEDRVPALRLDRDVGVGLDRAEPLRDAGQRQDR